MVQSVKRARQVADVIRHAVAHALKKSVQDPRLRSLSITSVEVSPDLRHAKIYYVPPQTADLALIKIALLKAIGFFRCVLADNLDMRYVPKIEFVYDEALERGTRISELINQALSDEKPAD